MRKFMTIAGPCSVESEKQIIEIARAVKDAGADCLRGSAFKLRTSPNDFQGIGKEGLKYLIEAKKETGLPVITEISDYRLLELYSDIDFLQVGERNMQNTDLLKELGKYGKPVLLKRGRGCTIKELLCSAEYISKEGNNRIILCERGIRTFETSTRNTMDISAIPSLHGMTSYPVIADPSHGTGRSELVESMSLAAVAAGADGLLIEVHNNPSCALSDGRQAITSDALKRIIKKTKEIRKVLGLDKEPV